jgi:SP family galactose:H+ symporter-like MFS transporter
MMLTYKPKKFVYVVAIAAALAGLLFGVDIGAITGALPFIRGDFNLNDQQQGVIVSSVLIGAVLGTLISGYISRRFGRHLAILISSIIFCIGALLSAFATSPDMLIGVRIFLGIALGLASFTAPLYLSEVAPQKIRGALIALYQFMITVGILAAFMSDMAFTPAGAWRWMLGVTFIPAFIMFLSVLALPKSPRWLMLRGEREETIAVLNRVRHEHEVIPETDEIAESVKHAHGAMAAFRMKGFKKLLFLGVMLQLLQQFSGINAVLYYAPTILKMAGFATPEQQIWWTVIIGLVNCLTTIVAIAVIDKLGRRPVLFFGSTVIIVSLVLLGLAFHVGMETHAMQVLAVICILTFIVGFAISLGPVIWILCAEIFPLQGRDIGVTFSTTSNWICNAIVGFSFLLVLHRFGPAGTFWMFSGIGVFTLWFFAYCVPETKGVSLEKIEQNLLQGKRLRFLGATVPPQ